MDKRYCHPSVVEREEISRGMASRHLVRLGRSLSTVSRELRRNAVRPDRYRATTAQWHAQRRARLARRPRNLADRWLRRYVGRRLGQGWSPQQIAARLAEVEARRVPGHWEGDLLKGRANGSAVASLVERTTRLVMLARFPGLDSWSVVQGFARKLQGIRHPLRKSMTFDQGREMARHELLSRKLPCRSALLTRICFAIGT
jgi:IS30 family transposase